MEELSAIMSRYCTTLCAVVAGLEQIVKKSEKMSMWILASIGSSPKRKYRQGMGEWELSLRKPRRILLWKVDRVFIRRGRTGRAERPDLRIGRL